MAAKFIQIGDPAHDAERQALRFLVDGLPDTVGGVDVGVVREGAARCAEAVEAGRFGPTAVPRIGPTAEG